ncbi:GEVED domain-containing protein [Hymenobacter sp. IS2118]|uniref:GEVED domain-containing protein n=1 Tax=Hymenobacter sp. IS2118 TaxID=1505605 RepID=UPI00137882F9|nr:GEVED domain-containing protein [Hymenobacter sp. IS2118]
MASLLRFWFCVGPGIVAVLLLFGPAAAVAQTTCPVAPTCTPGRASSPQAAAFGMGILNVTLGTTLINNTTAGQSEGYQDYSCTLNAALLLGQSYPISIRTNAGTPENVRVWIDYNNDGAFTGNNELVFSSNNRLVHTGTITPPTGATVGSRLRLRVAADFADGVVPTSCSTPQYSQTEDYSVTLASNMSAPAAAFTTDGLLTCTGCVQFTDASQNLPTSWLWDFGDGTSSTERSPRHCYATAGTYRVSLQATNAAGTNTSATTSVVYDSLVPAAASCAPQTVNYFASYGITKFELNTIENSSANGSAGYQDFTCPQRTELTLDVPYPMTITTGGTNPHDIRVYLDANNDGVFATSELLFESLNTPSPGASTTISLPAGAVLDQGLRLRVVADAVGNNPGPCTRPVSGQVEDYTVVGRANTLPPFVSFSSNYMAGGCVNPVQFTDRTTNMPTAWRWDFGDGSTSTEQNPSHQYTTAGTYNVTLAATNANGTASVTRLNAVRIQLPCLNYCAANGTGGYNSGGTLLPTPFFITAVRVSTAQPAYANVTGSAPGGYANYTNQAITIGSGRPVALSVTTNLAIMHRTFVWVDWDTNGVFDNTELVADGVTSGASAATYEASFTPPANSGALNTRMRVLSVVNTNTIPACSGNVLNAEVEDYQLRVMPLATRAQLALPALVVFPNPTPDGRLHLRLTEPSAAGTYAAEVQNLLGATLLRTTLRLAPTAEAALDLSALAPGVYVLRLRDAQGQTAVRRVVRE